MSGDIMNFPDNWWEFVQQYQFADKDEIYTNGSMLIPSFRVRQMVEHYFDGEVGKLKPPCGGRYCPMCSAAQSNKCELREALWDNGECTWGVVCSKCGRKYEHETGICWNYCPNCGRKVR